MRVSLLATLTCIILSSLAFAQPIDSQKLNNRAKERIYSDLFNNSNNSIHSSVGNRWQKEAFANIGLDIHKPLNVPRIKLNKRITAAYSKMYLDNPKIFHWAGMAAYASDLVGKSMKRARALREMAGNPGAAPFLILLNTPTGAELYQALSAGNIAVYEDIYWQHLAYNEEGLAAIEEAFANGYLSEQALQGWQKIDEGRKLLEQGSLRNNESLINEGNTQIKEGNLLLLEFEQKQVLQKSVYDKHRSAFKWLSSRKNVLGLNSPIPGHQDNFGSYSENGDLGNFQDRWEWIVGSVLPAWEELQALYPHKVIKNMNEFTEASVYSKKTTERSKQRMRRLGISLGNGKIPTSTAGIIHRKNNWYLVQRPEWSDPVSVLDGRSLPVQTIVREVSDKAKELGLSRGESIVVGGDPKSNKFNSVVAALEAKGFDVEPISTIGLELGDALTKVAETAHDFDSQIGVLLETYGEADPLEQCEGMDGDCRETDGPRVKDNGDCSKEAEDCVGDETDDHPSLLNLCKLNPEKCSEIVLDDDEDGPYAGGGGPPSPPGGGGSGDCPPDCSDNDDDGDGNGDNSEKDSIVRSRREGPAFQPLPTWSTLEFETFEQFERPFYDLQIEAGKGKSIPDPGPLISK